MPRGPHASPDRPSSSGVDVSSSALRFLAARLRERRRTLGTRWRPGFPLRVATCCWTEPRGGPSRASTIMRTNNNSPAVLPDSSRCRATTGSSAQATARRRKSVEMPGRACKPRPRKLTRSPLATHMGTPFSAATGMIVNSSDPHAATRLQDAVTVMSDWWRERHPGGRPAYLLDLSGTDGASALQEAHRRIGGSVLVDAQGLTAEEVHKEVLVALGVDLSPGSRSRWRSSVRQLTERRLVLVAHAHRAGRTRRSYEPERLISRTIPGLNNGNVTVLAHTAPRDLPARSEVILRLLPVSVSASARTQRSGTPRPVSCSPGPGRETTSPRVIWTLSPGRTRPPPAPRTKPADVRGPGRSTICTTASPLAVARTARCWKAPRCPSAIW